MRRPDGRTVWRADHTIIRSGVRSTVSGTGATRAEALTRLERNKIKKDVLRGLRPSTDLHDDELPETWRTTFGEWTAEVIATNSKLKSQHSRIGVETRLRLHINGEGGIGHIPLRLLTPQDIDRFIHSTLPNKSKEDGTPVLSQDVIRQIYYMVKRSCEQAVLKKLLVFNPAAQVEPPDRQRRADTGVRKLIAWVPHHLLQHIEDTPDEARWLVAFLGLRQAEALGLTDDCIHFGAKGVLVVQQQLYRRATTHGCEPVAGGKWACGRQSNNCPQVIGSSGLYIRHRTKTDAGYRVLPLVEPYKSVLKAHLERQKELRKLPTFDPLPGEGMDKLLFTTATGRPRRQQNDTAAWTKLLQDHKVPHMRGHLARHITTSILDAQGVPHGRIAEIMGWTDTRMMKTYSQTSAASLVEPLELLGTNISNRRSKEREAIKLLKEGSKDKKSATAGDITITPEQQAMLLELLQTRQDERPEGV